MTSEQDRTRVDSPHRLWEILNSQLMLWVLGSVVLSLITYYWAHDATERREDSQFLSAMLPYLAKGR